ncbi:Fc.00g046590.m01.CDS01 [Cosmosporella sp. VM-42]
MPSNYTKIDRPSAPRLDTKLSIPEKATLSNVTTICPSAFDKSPRMSNVSTPQSDKSRDPFDTDIEAMVPTHTKESSMLRNQASKKTDCQVWPGKDDWKKQAKDAKLRRKRCTCMAQMRRRNRIICKILIGFLIVGIAVGVGFGVSKPLNAPIWGDDSKN